MMVCAIIALIMSMFIYFVGITMFITGEIKNEFTALYVFVGLIMSIIGIVYIFVNN
jgi:hypothetical protein